MYFTNVRLKGYFEDLPVIDIITSENKMSLIEYEIYCASKRRNLKDQRHIKLVKDVTGEFKEFQIFCVSSL